jgi:large subunit ribosomal protein L15
MSMKLNELKPPEDSRKKGKRFGRGQGSGRGGTCGRGNKGQLSRSGGNVRIGFEGGQMPLQRRIPKFGFTNIFRKEYQIVNLEQLNRFSEGETINKEVLLNVGIIKKKNGDIKILGDGEVKKAMSIEANAFSKSAIEKISKAGGKAIVV